LELEVFSEIGENLTNIYTIRRNYSQEQKTLETTVINFEQELKTFFPKSHWAIIRDFKNSLKQEIARFL
jgi:hypothetical protein